jgi:hypothetical protein
MADLTNITAQQALQALNEVAAAHNTNRATHEYLVRCINVLNELINKQTAENNGKNV